MDPQIIACNEAAALGRSLKTWRQLRRLKQTHAAELLSVSQATMSRWENGLQAPTVSEQASIRQLLQARFDSAADHELARLVTQSSQPIHLICDLTHRLLAWSRTRSRQCRTGRADLIGTSLWPYASEAVMQAEAELPRFGWFEPSPPAVEGYTGANRSRRLRISPSRFRWVRFQLSDGSFARLVETLPN